MLTFRIDPPPGGGGFTRVLLYQGFALPERLLFILALIVYPTITMAESTWDNEVVLIAGADGTPDFAKEITESVSLWQQACAKGRNKVTTIGIAEEKSKDADYAALENHLQRTEKQDSVPLWLVFIGHGTFDGRSAKFNLRGKDISAAELSDWLKPIHRPLAILDMASSSAPFINELSGPDRVILTATKSGFEQNYARYHRYFAGAIGEKKADLDKDGQTSLLEAFLFAAHGVSEFYAGAGRLATEHALIDDNGDGLGTRADWFRGIRPVKKARDGAPLDGYRAHQFHLLRSAQEKKIPPVLRRQRDQLELQVIRLRDSVTGPPDDAYFSQLEDLLKQIGRIYENLEKQESAKEARGL